VPRVPAEPGVATALSVVEKGEMRSKRRVPRHWTLLARAAGPAARGAGAEAGQ